MHAELIAIGAELLLGEITDTNSAHIARALREIGLEVRWMSTVGDDVARAAELVAHAARRSPIVITTGGLGPTVDDPAREAVARAFDRPLEYRPELWAQIEERFRRFRRKPTENNRRQAHIPAGAIPLENPVGTAPAFIVEHEHGAVVALPGVPREMEYLLAHSVVPYLRERFGLSGVIRAKVLRTVGLGESMVDEKVGEFEKGANPAVGLLAHAGQVDIRITAAAQTEAEADALIAPVEAQIRARLGEFIYGEGKETVEEAAGRLLAERGMTVAVAESGARGQLAARLAAAPGAERFFLGGEPLSQNVKGPLQEAELVAEAERVRMERGAHWGLALSVVAAEGAHIEIALTDGHQPETRSPSYGGHPAYAPLWASTAALNLLRLRLLRPT
jgi:competence/damage-inducible protein CinA-like protein